MVLKIIPDGAVAKAAVLNDNFVYLEELCTNLDSTKANKNNVVNLTGSQIIAGNKTFSGVTTFTDTVTMADVNFPSGTSNIGDPVMTLSNNLPTKCIWLNGAAVSRTAYAKLFEIYGVTYGSGDGVSTFNLPNFTGRAIWGANDFGYIEAGLPNITGWANGVVLNEDAWASSGGSFSTPSIDLGNAGWEGDGGYNAFQVNFDASRSNGIYGASNTVQPPAIKVRVYTRYE